MSWQTLPGGVLTWPAGLPFPEPDDAELVPYGHVVPTQPGCGVPGVGRKQHQRAGEPTCRICKDAETAYKRERKREKRAS